MLTSRLPFCCVVIVTALLSFPARAVVTQTCMELLLHCQAEKRPATARKISKVEATLAGNDDARARITKTG